MAVVIVGSVQAVVVGDVVGVVGVVVFVAA